MNLTLRCAERGIRGFKPPPLDDIIVAVPKKWKSCFYKQHYVLIVEHTLKHNQDVALRANLVTNPQRREYYLKQAESPPPAVLHLFQKPWSKQFTLKWDDGPQDSLATLAKRFEFISTLPACTKRCFDIFQAASDCTPSEHREALEAQILTSLKALNAKHSADAQRIRSVV